jgi:hypothetical protein
MVWLELELFLLLLHNHNLKFNEKIVRAVAGDKESYNKSCTGQDECPTHVHKIHSILFMFERNTAFYLFIEHGEVWLELELQGELPCFREFCASEIISKLPKEAQYISQYSSKVH